MKNLIIYAHPKQEGHCATVLSEVKNKLDSKKEDYLVLDLYGMNYNPVLTTEEFTPEGHTKANDENKLIQDKITSSENIIFIFPAWWGGMPAILKGFFDRVFTEGFALSFEGKLPKGLLKGKHATVFMTTGGPKIAHFIMGNRYKKLIKKDILEFSGLKTDFVHIGNCRTIDEKKKAEIKDMVEEAMDEE
jgi:NAD(P)H dehydrogenase (quinone)